MTEQAVVSVAQRERDTSQTLIINFTQNEVETSFSFSTIALVVYCFFGAVFLLLACFLFVLGLTPTLPCCGSVYNNNNQ